ncbi:hypothetical protein M8818_004713 [Zalaria obscura]|uniref:Uncharacterized protein n=1 Tax=Zalaria obscura TaxID=2024903 RepID=A0ACC3SCK9_9PEZI
MSATTRDPRRTTGGYCSRPHVTKLVSSDPHATWAGRTSHPDCCQVRSRISSPLNLTVSATVVINTPVTLPTVITTPPFPTYLPLSHLLHTLCYTPLFSTPRRWSVGSKCTAAWLSQTAMSTISECEARISAIRTSKALLEHQLLLEREEKELSILEWKLETERASSRAKRKRKRKSESFDTAEEIVNYIKAGPAGTASKRRKAPSSLLSLFTGEEPYEYIFYDIAKYLDVGSLVALTRTCKRLSGVYQTLLQGTEQWNVDYKLYNFVNNPRALRYTMGKCGALISGSFALQFFERANWEDADLDIFVEDGADAAEMVQYVEQIEHYGDAKHVSLGQEVPHQYLKQVCVHQSHHASQVCMLTLSQIRTYQHYPDSSGKPTQIKLLITSTLPLRAILMTCYTTAHANIISWNKAYALFPKITFTDNKIVLARHLDDRLGSILARYSKRGWRSTERLANLSDVSQDLVFQRRIGDNSTWIIPFDTTHVRNPGLPDYVLEYSGFTLNAENHPRFASNKQFQFEASVFASCVLKYRYTSGEDGWNRFLERKTAPLATVEMCKMPPKLRPRNTLPVIVNDDGSSSFGNGGANGATAGEESEMYYTEDQEHWPAFSVEFEKPRGWEFADELIPRWREEWLREWHEFISGQFGSDDEDEGGAVEEVEEDEEFD